jgi:hypothetical protein
MINYIEFYVKVDDQTDIPEDTFHNLLNRMKSCKTTSGNFFQKTIYEESYEEFNTFQMFDNFVSFSKNQKAIKERMVVINPVEPSNIDTQSPFHRLIKRTDVISMFYYKEDLPLSTFPSTSKCFEKQLEQRASFKVFNRLYMNFSKIQYVSRINKIYNHIYFNYHFTERLDVDEHVRAIESILDFLIVTNNQ